MSTRKTHRLRNQALDRDRRARRHRPTLDALENKALLAVTSSFAAGTLTVSSDAGDPILINSVGGNVLINGADPGTGVLAAADVVALDVDGGPLANDINLSQITAAVFTALATVDVDGGFGDDTIQGTALADILAGSFGNDTISGLGGADTIRGGFGDDTIIGGQGADTLLGNEVAFNVPALFGVDDANQLVLFAANNPGTILRTNPILGLGVGEDVVGLDARPANRLLYALTDLGNVYVVEPATGLALQVSTLSVPLDGTAFGVDFNPVPDRMRIVSDTGQNLRVNVETGVATVDTPLNYAVGDPNFGATPDVAGVAYTNSIRPSPRTPPPGTTLFDIDATLDILVTQNPPNDGALNTVGALGIDVTDAIGFDIVPGANTALASLVVGGATGLYTIDLATGAATAVGDIGSGATPLRGLTTLDLDDDTFIWNNTDGSDVIDGGFGIDAQFVNGSTNQDVFLASPGAGGRLNFQRTSPGPFALDIGGVENLTVNGLIGSDFFTVEDLTGVADILEVNYFGGDDPDALSLGDGATLLGGSYDGGAGSDTINYSDYTTAVTVDLDTGVQTFTAGLDTDQEVPPNASPATGLGEFVLNDTATALSFNVTYAGLQGLLAGSGMAHFHLGQPGVNGEIVRGLTEAELNGRTAPDGSFFGVWTDADTQPLTPDLVEALRANGLYFNIHTTSFPGGEIRGQILLSGTQGTATGTAGLINVENVVGGSADDILNGNDQANGLRGGPGADTLAGLAGDDIFSWLNGDGSDTVAGGTGFDTQRVSGADAGDAFEVLPAVTVGNFLFRRTNLVPFTLDIGTVENLEANGELGQDTFTVRDLTGVADLVAVNLDGGADDDSIDAAALPAGVLTNVLLAGGTGNDTILGSQGVDAIFGGPGNDNITANRGADAITAGPGPEAAFMVALRADDTLVFFDADDPTAIDPEDVVPITGLDAGEDAVGIDYRPAETRDVLYLLTDAGRVYTATPDGQATLLSTLSVTPAGTGFGTDFNPVPDRLRVVSNTGQNLRANVATGATITDTNLAYATGDPNAGTAPQVTGVAYTNSFAGATSTTLYDIDPNLDVLAIQNPPNNGVLNTVGALGVDAGPGVGFDILAGAVGTAYATLSVGGSTGLYTINLATGAATLVSVLGDGTGDVVGLAAQPDNDTVTWNNGDGTDTVDGGYGQDAQVINGAAAAGDNFLVTAGQGGRLQFNRTNLGLFGIDMGGIEVLRMNPLGGDDTVTVQNLTGVVGLQRIESNLGDGNDRFDASALTVALPTFPNGDAGDDTLIGGPGNDTLDGGAGSNKAVVNGGQNTVLRASPTAGDYDGDGRADLALYRFDPTGNQGFFFLQQTTGGQRIEAMSGLGADDVVVTGDFDGDGKADIGVVNPTGMIDGSTIPNATIWSYVQSSNGLRVDTPFGAPGTLDRPAPGDYDGDGKTDLATFRANSDIVPGAAQWFIAFSSGGSADPVFGAPGGLDLPAVADYDGDGKTDITTFRPVSNLSPGSSQWFVLPSAPNPNYDTSLDAFTVVFGAGGNVDQPAPADYDNDGRADITSFRSTSDITPGSSDWFTIPSGLNSINYQPPPPVGGTRITLGQSGSIAAPSDYTGDLIPDLAVYNPATAVWTVRPTGGGANLTFNFGVANDGSVPVLAPLFFRIPPTPVPASATRVAGLRISLATGEDLGATVPASKARRRLDALDRAIDDLFPGTA